MSCWLLLILFMIMIIAEYADPTAIEETTETITATYPNELIQFRIIGIADCYNWVVRIT